MNAECRFCLTEDSKANLLSPCKCRGTVEFVHSRCLSLWVLANGGNIRCNMCLDIYSYELGFIPFRQWWKWPEGLDKTLHCWSLSWLMASPVIGYMATRSNNKMLGIMSSLGTFYSGFSLPFCQMLTGRWLSSIIVVRFINRSDVKFWNDFRCVLFSISALFLSYCSVFITTGYNVSLVTRGMSLPHCHHL